MKIIEDGIFANRKEWIKIGSVKHALNVSFKMIALTFLMSLYIFLPSSYC